MINDGSGDLSMDLTAFNTGVSEGTLAMVVVDLNGDGRPDVVEAQGENPAASDERVYLASDRMAPDFGIPDHSVRSRPGRERRCPRPRARHRWLVDVVVRPVPAR